MLLSIPQHLGSVQPLAHACKLTQNRICKHACASSVHVHNVKEKKEWPLEASNLMPAQYAVTSRTLYLLFAESKFASRLALMEATVVSRNLRPACSAVPRVSSLNPVWMGATTTLMFSSPELPGGPKAASGSATPLLDLHKTTV